MSSERGRLVIGNWKMNLGEAAARSLVAALVAELPFDRVDAAAGTPLAISAQDVYWAEPGAFTGEVSAAMLAEMGVRFVIVGHSERRRLFEETDETVSRKAAACRRHGLVPVVCVGETEHQRNTGLTRDVVAAQTSSAFSGVPQTGPQDLIVAYEPVWAIGSGRTPSALDVTEAHRAIREALAERFGDRASRARILYGGSVTPANAAELLRADEVAGALVGGASLDAAAFREIVEAAG